MQPGQGRQAGPSPSASPWSPAWTPAAPGGGARRRAGTGLVDTERGRGRHRRRPVRAQGRLRPVRRPRVRRRRARRLRLRAKRFGRPRRRRDRTRAGPDAETAPVVGPPRDVSVRGFVYALSTGPRRRSGRRGARASGSRDGHTRRGNRPARAAGAGDLAGGDTAGPRPAGARTADEDAASPLGDNSARAHDRRRLRRKVTSMTAGEPEALNSLDAADEGNPRGPRRRRACRCGRGISFDR
jgi:hypothetical protein